MEARHGARACSGLRHEARVPEAPSAPGVRARDAPACSNRRALRAWNDARPSERTVRSASTRRWPRGERGNGVRVSSTYAPPQSP
ncbi:hypothetical protein UC34_19165 [Pandoraea vervacti]|uniref:Uncharacterized protein n=1 Tax=Pandoraea vervacti TaxID=656178 RepID=A0ABM5T0Z9_9BURK|nr:hypothetical protein UC34_19165 [Pandoraea vervacti]